MCMFSRPVREVAATRIFARHLDSGDQALVYGMNVSLSEPTAMILPLPVPPHPGEDAVRFVDLSGYADFFQDLHRAFPAPVSRAQAGAMSRSLESNATLKVHRVGSFEASFVPSLGDFDRLDRRFRLADDVWSALPYDDWGFAVFQLADEPTSLLGRMFGGKRAPTPQTIHPMAFVFPRRDPRTLFFPTLHVHDGAVHPMAEFDHQLYCQPDAITAASFSWRASAGPVGNWVDAAKAQALVEASAIDLREPAFLLTFIGTSRNRDITLCAPDITLEALRPKRALFQLLLSAYPAYFDEACDEPGATQRRIARNHLADLGQRLIAELEPVLESERAGWQLDAYDDDAIEHTMSSTYSEGRTEIRLCAPGGIPPWQPGWKAPEGRGRVRFGITHERLGSLGVVLTFSELPTSETYQAIKRALDACVESVWQAMDV